MGVNVFRALGVSKWVLILCVVIVFELKWYWGSIGVGELIKKVLIAMEAFPAHQLFFLYCEIVILFH